MTSKIQLPFYVRSAIFLVGLFVLISILDITQAIILPVIYALLIAILVSPMVNFLVKKKFPRVVAVGLVLLLAILIISGIVLFFVSQANMLSEAWPTLAKKFTELYEMSLIWISENFNIKPKEANAWVAKTQNELLNSGSSHLGATISNMGGVLATITLTPVYIFMILYYQPHLMKFTHQLFGANNDSKLNEILSETKNIVQSYLVGLFFEFLIMAALNSIGLLVLGIDYAILLGVLAALLNVIPYLGGIIAMFLISIITLVTKEPIYVLYVLGLYTVIQFIDNNFIVPKVVGSKVKLNAFVSLIAVILGAALWGVPGMFLSIPFAAIIKLVFDRIDSLKPWGFLMGDTMPPLVDIKKPTKKDSTK